MKRWIGLAIGVALIAYLATGLVIVAQDESGVVRRFGAASLTPARRAFDNPIAIACFVLAAPCLPSRMWCISSRTNSPACVLGDFPSASSPRARLIVSFSGMILSQNENSIHHCWQSPAEQSKHCETPGSDSNSQDFNGMRQSL